MSDYSFPDGHYFSVIGNIRIGAGGQTRMALLRHRLIQTHANIAIPMVTFNPVPSYEPIRENLLTEGLLLPSSQIINMHEWLRHHPYGEDLGRVPAQPEESFTVDETYDGTGSGTVWRIFVKGAHSGEDHWDYLRPDGTRYLRTPADSMLGTTLVLDEQERVVADLDGLGDLWRWWMTELLPADGPVFLISDSRFIAFELGMLNNPRVHVLHQVHNPHQGGQRRWNSPVSASYEQSMNSISDLDALSVLTERQRHDIELFYGDRNNIVVIPNPSEPIIAPTPLPQRTHGRIVMVARLESQKRIERAISAFAIVAAKNAVAHLDIYGDGPDRAELDRQILESGLTDRITLHGHTPNAADQFWTADLGWLTSAFEGYCLALLEARLRACPFVALDVPYGPSEQINSGVDGVLVPNGDVERFAEETLALLADPERLEAMREPARQGALEHGFEDHLNRWADACALAQVQKSSRTHIEFARLSDLTLRLAGTHPRLTAVITVAGTGDRSALNVRWQMWVAESPAPVDLPVEFNLEGDEIHISGLGVARDLPFAADDPHVTGRLLIEWQNSTHSIDLTRKQSPSKVKQFALKVRNRLRD